MELGAKFFDIFWGDDLLWCHAIIQPYRLFGSAPKVCGGGGWWWVGGWVVVLRPILVFSFG